MADQPYILALDIGTSSTRALLYDAHGTAVPGVQAQFTYQLTTSHEGEASVDADFLLALVARTIDEVLRAAGTRVNGIAAVATSAFWHTLVPLDAAGCPLLPLLTWEDTRPRQAAIELRLQLDEASTHRRTGTRLHACYWPAKIRWLASAYPEIAERTARYVSFSEYLHERFLGRAVCSLSMASGTGLLNTRTGTWDSEMLAHLHLSPVHLPTPGDLPDTLRGLTPEFAERWPVLDHVPWFPAIGDGAAANLGSNCADPSTWAVTMGTSSAMRVVVPPEQVEPEQGLWLYYVDQKRALLGGALSEGGNMLSWLQNTLKIQDLTELDQQLTGMEPAAHGLTILPKLAGERSPGWHSYAAMAISGITLHTTPAEIARASLEAVIFQIGEIHDQLVHALRAQVTQPRLIANGGALLKSTLLSQLLADTLNRPLELSESSEASARGAALLALETLQILPDMTQLVPETIRTVQPDPVRHTIYTKARERQQAFYNVLFSSIMSE
ncbi:gluconokinase [Ktedonobacter racemifer]|uniref:Carbohydrate kinase, FGGY n=1 Tax=Ktedonobacter racemifer DSM 44963 TaxID=485913 RepID=D6U705_KTERA|nr:gluconokinase [Ktedonobacter racemifer]EFH79666.1 Carbohydrate kinase, FGGY [Ktedonobacter racemifer DSM 44963]